MGHELLHIGWSLDTWRGRGVAVQLMGHELLEGAGLLELLLPHVAAPLTPLLLPLPLLPLPALPPTASPLPALSFRPAKRRKVMLMIIVMHSKSMGHEFH